MNKLKKVFGGTKEDELPTTTATGEEIQTERRRSSILRQILNPDGNKYDETIHGTPKTNSPNVPPPEERKVDPNAKLVTDPDSEEKDRGIVRQIMDPRGQKYDETRHGSTVVPTEDGGRPTASTVPEPSAVAGPDGGDRIESQDQHGTAGSTGGVEYWKK